MNSEVYIFDGKGKLADETWSWDPFPTILVSNVSDTIISYPTILEQVIEKQKSRPISDVIIRRQLFLC